MPNKYPRGAPNADPNADYYKDWELTNRPAMLPFLAEYTNTKTGEKSGGMAMPSMVTSPANALWQLVGPAGGMWDIENPQNADALREVNMATLGSNALQGMAAGALKSPVKNALGMFGGQRAATADLEALSRAQKLAEGGATRDAIWDQTGWFQGPDKQWRFEIDDSGAKFNVAGDYPWSVSNALNHPDLTAAYPDLAGVKIGRTAPTGGGSYMEDLDRISLGLYPHHKDGSTLLHETQHALQSRESFARGNNSKDAPADIQSSGLGYEWYRRHAGEVEARNVQTRMNMTPEERRANPPWTTQDIPYEDQIVRMQNGGPQYSIPNALSRGGEQLLSDTAKPNPLGAALASNADLAATGTGNSLAPRLGEGSPLPSPQHVGQMGEGLQGHSQSLAGQQGQGIHNLMQNGQSSNSSSVTPIGSFLDKNYYPSSGLNPIHEVHDWSKVRALARAAIRGDHVPGYLYEGQPNNGNLLAGTHRAAANELLDMLGYRKRIDHASIDDVMDDPASYGLTQSDADNLRDAVAYADYGEIDNIWDISRDTSLFSDTGRPSLMGSALASEQSQNSIFDILRLNGMY